jgi:hypothetical protein
MTLDPGAVPTIHRAVELAVAGLGTTLIAATLNAEGHRPPPTRNRRNQYVQTASSGWTHGRVSNLLRHPALVGTLIRKGAPDLVGYYPPVLMPEGWATLRAAMEQRDTLRGQLRGGSQKVHSLFQTVIRCVECGGPISFHAPSTRAKPGHPGYMACREGNRRQGGTCTNKGYIQADQLEAHCLTRLQLTDWEALLRRPEDDQDRHQLEQEVARLNGERDRTAAQIKAAKERAEDAFLAGATDARLATIEGAMARLQGQLEAITTDLAGASRRLAIARARPTSADAATELSDRIHSFRIGLATATPTERLAFNRWLLSRQPAIEFRLGPKPVSGGDRLVWLLVDGRRVSYAPLAGPARQWAREQGMVDPALAIAEQLPSGDTAVLLLKERPAVPRGRLVVEHGARLLVISPAAPLAEAEPPFDWPWAVLFTDAAGAGGEAES